MENLQTQPIEVIDKYIVSELLPKWEKDLSPFLQNLMQDPVKVKEVTNSIKRVVELGSFSESLQLFVPSTPRTTSSIIEQVESVGLGIEEGESLNYHLCTSCTANVVVPSHIDFPWFNN
jgi:hypothetical protein